MSDEKNPVLQAIQALSKEQKREHSMKVLRHSIDWQGGTSIVDVALGLVKRAGEHQEIKKRRGAGLTLKDLEIRHAAGFGLSARSTLNDAGELEVTPYASINIAVELKPHEGRAKLTFSSDLVDGSMVVKIKTKRLAKPRGSVAVHARADELVANFALRILRAESKRRAAVEAITFRSTVPSKPLRGYRPELPMLDEQP